MSTRHWHTLKKMGLPVICIDARHAKAALSLQINKTDRNDALGLAQIMRTGWYRGVGVKSLDSHKVRAVLGARAAPELETAPVVLPSECQPAPLVE